MYDPLQRENSIMEILGRLAESGLPFVVVGGYAVSAFRHRFSIDADIVISKEDLPGFERILKDSGYAKTISKKLEDAYSSEFMRYERKDMGVSVDLLIGGIAVRQTGAAFSFRFLMENSEKRAIEGIEKSVNVQVPVKEVIIIMKLHSGRLTDLRDVAALASGLDLGRIKDAIFRGDIKALERNLRQLAALIEKKEFQDSFKGVFMEKNYRIDTDEIRRLSAIRDAPAGPKNKGLGHRKVYKL